MGLASRSLTSACEDRKQSSVTFEVSCPADFVYVLIADERGRNLAVAEMESANGYEWNLRVPLPPGTYRYRYYANSGGTITYVSPGAGGFRGVDDGPVLSRRGRRGGHQQAP